MSKLPRILLFIGLAIGAFSLIASFAMSISHHMGEGRTLTYAIGRYFGFLTILTNIWLVLVYLAELTSTPALRLFRNTAIKAGALASILLVAIYQHAILYAISDPLTGLNWLNDFIHHSAAPLVYLAWWIITSPRNDLSWKSLPLMLVPLVIYAIYVLVRGPIINEYPYPALDVAKNGFASVLAYMGMITIAMLILGTIIIFANYLALRFKPSAAQDS